MVEIGTKISLFLFTKRQVSSDLILLLIDVKECIIVEYLWWLIPIWSVTRLLPLDEKVGSIEIPSKSRRCESVCRKCREFIKVTDVIESVR